MRTREAETALAPEDVPTFTECVIGYRAWNADRGERLWPLTDNRRPWEPGINTARCNCHRDGLEFDWTWHDGRRVLAPAPPHAAPDGACSCGLYSWRRPRPAWAGDPKCAAGRVVVGAVASWGRMQVHKAGFRAEHACVVTLATPPGASAATRAELERIARRYRVDLVALARLEEAASRHGTPLPDALVPPAEPVAGLDDAAAPTASRARRYLRRLGL